MEDNIGFLYFPALKLNCSKFSIFAKLTKEVDIFAKGRALNCL